MLSRAGILFAEKLSDVAAHASGPARMLDMHSLRYACLSAAAFVAATCVPAQQVEPWQMQDSGVIASFRGVDSVDGTIAWASGTEGTVLKTTDGGTHWQKCAVPDGDKDGATLDFRGVQAWGAQSAVVMASGPGDKSRLYKTTDGCRTWKLLFKNPDAPDGFFDSLYVMKEQRSLKEDEGFGLLLGDPVRGELSVFETRDAGRTWLRLHDPLLTTESGAFAASNRCIAGENATDEFIMGGKSKSAVLRLNYEGKYWLNDGARLVRSWSARELPLASGSESTGAFAISTHVIVTYGKTKNDVLGLRLSEVAVGGDYSKPNEAAGTAAYTNEGGEHWTSSIAPPHGYRSTVQWSVAEKLWITAGSNGSDISRDDGKTWGPLDNGNWNALSLPFIVGPKGRIARLNPDALKQGR
jgi:photosystem II stability/assembly factor-like uncharacterized protein